MSCSSSVRKAVSNGVVGGKTARACDNCVKKRARWYCAADDAFLCQACDHSVHSANSLARRHERVRLKTASSSSLKPSPTDEEALAPPSWHRGFTRKARTPRSGKKHVTRPKLRKDQARDQHHHHQFDPLVPEICGDETSHEENEEQLLYRVPIFDPFVAELCTANSANSNELVLENSTANNVGDSRGLIESKAVSPSWNTNMQQHEFLPTETDLAEFAADVESLLGRGLENECFGMEELGFVDCEEKELRRVKVKEEDEDDEAMEGKDLEGCCWPETSTEIDMMRPEPLELNFEDYEDSPASCGEEDDQKVVSVETAKAASTVVQETKNDEEKEKKSKKRKKILLRLDYEAVITAWASQGSPWFIGDRPDFDPDACWPDFMGTYATSQLHHHQYMDMSGAGVNPAILADGGREARVSRYREKRRTRLFSKKIRYEVRKLNAEKRPRMKGRFVKRANSFAGPSTFPMLTSK